MKNQGPLAIALSACVFGFFFGTAQIWAQATTGSVSGRVSDPSRAVVPHAAVKAREEATGLVQETLTNTTGEYSLAVLPPGRYTLTISKEGFNAAVVNSLLLAIDGKL